MPLKFIQINFHSLSFDQNAIIWVIQAREEAQVQVEDEAEVAINNTNDLVIIAASIVITLPVWLSRVGLIVS